MAGILILKKKKIMATTLPSEVYGEFLMCGLCHDTLQRPKLLPCNHTYCQGRRNFLIYIYDKI